VRDAQFSIKGMDKVLKLRAGFNGVEPTKTSNDYYDDSFYMKALNMLELDHSSAFNNLS
jgi:hypothetical protein